MSDIIILRDRTLELCAALRAACPPARLNELERELLNFPPVAAKPATAGEWAGLCVDYRIIYLDPDQDGLLSNYQHELAHAATPGHGHDEVFQEVNERLHARFGIPISDWHRFQYDCQDAAPAERSADAVSCRHHFGRRLAETGPADVAALAEQRRWFDYKCAREADWVSVLVPLFWLSLTVVPVLLFWLFRDHLPNFIQQWPLETAGVVGFALCMAIALWPSSNR